MSKEPTCPKCDKSIRYERAHIDGLCEACAKKLMRLSEGEKLAEKHAIWLFDLLRKVYVEAFEHGYKHGWDDYYEMAKEDDEK